MKSKKLFREIKKALSGEAKKMGKNVDWFRFAIRNKRGGWRFLANKQNQLKRLEEIAEKIGEKNKKYKTGKIADLISETVNM